jgi:hypothetical protein
MISKKSNKGYTLVELIIAIQLFFIILSFAYTIYLFGYKFLFNWEEKNTLITDELQIKRVLLNELSKSKGINIISMNTIEYINPNYSLNKIEYLQNNIFLNQRRLNHAKVKIISFQFNILHKMNDKLDLILLSQLDMNHDNHLQVAEFNQADALQIEFELRSKRFSRKNRLLISLIK